MKILYIFVSSVYLKDVQYLTDFSIVRANYARDSNLRINGRDFNLVSFRNFNKY